MPRRRLLDQRLIDNQKRCWEYNKVSKQYQLSEDIPLLDQVQGIYHDLALTDEGQLYDFKKKEILRYTPPLKQFRSDHGNYPIIFAITVDNNLVRVSLRSRTCQVIRTGVTHIICYQIRYRDKERNVVKGYLQVINDEGNCPKITLNKRLDMINKEVIKEDIDGKILKCDNNFIFASRQLYHQNTYGIERCGLDDEKISTIINIISAGHYPVLLALNNDNTLSIFKCLGSWEAFKETSRKNQYLIDRCQSDPWYKLIPSNKDGYIGIVSVSGRVSLINNDLAVLDIDIPAEIFKVKPTRSKSARNKA